MNFLWNATRSEEHGRRDHYAGCARVSQLHRKCIEILHVFFFIILESSIFHVCRMCVCLLQNPRRDVCNAFHLWVDDHYLGLGYGNAHRLFILIARAYVYVYVRNSLIPQKSLWNINSYYLFYD